MNNTQLTLLARLLKEDKITTEEFILLQENNTPINIPWQQEMYYPKNFELYPMQPTVIPSNPDWTYRPGLVTFTSNGFIITPNENTN